MQKFTQNFKRLYQLLIILTFNLVGANQLLATNYYVANNGSDSNNGLSTASAFLTLQHTTSVVAAGDTVFVLDGNYVGFDIRDENGTKTKPIVYKAMGSKVKITSSGPKRDDGINIENADYIVIDGFVSSNMKGNGNGIRVVLSDYCVIKNCICDNNAERGIFTGFTDDIIIENNICSNSVDEHGIYVSNSSQRPIVRYNECFGNNNIGIHMNGDLSAGGSGLISDAKIYGNIIHDNKQAAGINLDGVLGAKVFNNLIYNNHSAQGIALFKGDGARVSAVAFIYNNTIIVPDDGRWGILLKDGANDHTIIYNNIIINHHSFRGSISVEDSLNLFCDYNILSDKMSFSGDGSSIKLAAWQQAGFDKNSQIAKAMSTIFTNPTANDYNLLKTSQAVDAGTRFVAQLVKDDITGFGRPSGSDYDIGAYEYRHLLAAKSIKSPTQLIVYPNPSASVFKVNISKEKIKNMVLINAQGQIIEIKNKTNSINVSAYKKGCYYLLVELESGLNQYFNLQKQ